MEKFGDSPSKLITNIYSQYPWKVWNFTRVPDGYWNDKKNIRSFMEDLGQSLKFESFQDW